MLFELLLSFAQYFDLIFQLNVDIQPFVKENCNGTVAFSLNSAPVVLHQELIGREAWMKQIREVNKYIYIQGYKLISLF